MVSLTNRSVSQLFFFDLSLFSTDGIKRPPGALQQSTAFLFGAAVLLFYAFAFCFLLCFFFFFCFVFFLLLLCCAFVLCFCFMLLLFQYANTENLLSRTTGKPAYRAPVLSAAEAVKPFNIIRSLIIDSVTKAFVIEKEFTAGILCYYLRTWRREDLITL